ncbi:MAG: hypothetical protein ACHQKZ_10875 [Solirubrobacterales bacterium]
MGEVKRFMRFQTSFGATALAMALPALAAPQAPAPSATANAPGNQIAVAAGTAVEFRLTRPLSVDIVV